jgi:hypothetical protein
VIFPGTMTELSWQHDGLNFRAYSNVDFRLLSNVPEVETADAVYSFFFVPDLADLTTATAEEKSAAKLKFSPDHAQYVLVNPVTDLKPDDLTLPAIAALLTYYDRNQAGLLADYARREAASAASERQLRAHPPVTPDGTVFFWSIKGQPNPH